MKFKKLILAAALGATSFTANAYVSSWDWQTSTGFVDLGMAIGLGAPVSFAETDGNPGAANDGNPYNDAAGPDVAPYAPAGQENAPGPDTRTGEGYPENYFSDSAITNPILNTNLWETMTWGVPSDSSTNGLRSSINIGNLSSADGDVLETDGDWVIINDFTHNNYVLAGGSSNSPWSAMLFGGFAFTTEGVDYLTQAVGSPQPISLNETSNIEGGCEFPTPNNTECDDIFTTSGLSGSVMFHIDWEEHLAYWVEFAFFEGEGNADIIDEPLPGVYDIYTGENGSTTIHTVARVFTREVPEPAIIGLFGIGLLGMGLIGRRRKS